MWDEGRGATAPGAVTALVDPTVLRHLPNRPPVARRRSVFPVPHPASLIPQLSSPLPLRPRSASEIVDAALQLYRRDPLTYLLLSALCYAPVLVLQLIIIGPATRIEEQLSRLTAGFSVIMVFGYWVSLSLMGAVIVRLASEDYLGRRIEPAVAVRDALMRLPMVMVALLLKYILMVVGFFLFLVGFLYVMARYFAVTAGVVIEGRGALSTFGRSAALSRGHKMHILGTWLLAFVIFAVVYFGIAIVAATTGSIVISTILTTVASIAAYPMFAIIEMLLYYDARVRNEGYDIEMMAEAI